MITNGASDCLHQFSFFTFHVVLVIFMQISTIQTKFVQSFQLTGGSSGKITRGEEIVQMLLLRGSVSDQSSFDRVLKQRNKAKLVQLENLSMRNIVSI